MGTSANETRRRTMQWIRLVVLLALAAVSGQATILRTMDLDEMTQESSAIVHGRIVAARAEWNSTHTIILTIYTVRAERYLKGFHGAAFELAEMGGRIGDQLRVVPGAPHFEVGEEVVLFVWTAGNPVRHQAIGFEQGAFRVRTDPATGLKVVNHSQPVSARVGEQAMARRPDTSRGLNEFLAQVGDAVKRGKPQLREARQ